MTYLEINSINISINTSHPKQRIQLPSDWQSLGAPKMPKQPLLPITRTPNNLTLQRRERNHIRGPIREIQVLQTRRIGTHFHDLGVAFRAYCVHAFGDGGDKAWVEDVYVSWESVINYA